MDTKEIRRRNLVALIDGDPYNGNQAAFARALDVKPSQISRWISLTTTDRRGITEDSARNIENTLGLPSLYLDSQTSGFRVAEPRATYSASNTTSGPEIKGLCPLISWVQAGNWSTVIDNLAVGDAEEWLPCPVNHGPRTYVLRVKGESMHNPQSRPSFADGDLVFIDPDRTADNGSLVVVRLDDKVEATFKKLVIEGDEKYLRALNPGWPEPIMRINGNATLCGVAIAKMERL